MNTIESLGMFSVVCAIALATGFRSNGAAGSQPTPVTKPAPVYFHVDPASAGSIKGEVHFAGRRPVPAAIDMSGDPACVEAHHGKAHDESLVVGPKGELANAFIYIEKGLEGKTFEVPATPVVIDQKGCWFRPRILGIQTSQTFEVVNSDPVTHNIHPMAQMNREWNHSQGPGDPPLIRRFTKPEVMIPVKCNIHSWMHAFIGVLDHPYFAVSHEDGTFEISNLPAGTYTLAVWQEKLGTAEQQVTIAPHSEATVKLTMRGK
jgi:plastocyanin